MRYKTNKAQKMHLFPHRDDMELNCYFSLAYLLILNPGKKNDTYLFPSFAQKLFGKEELVDSQVSEIFNKSLDMFFTLMYEYQKSKYSTAMYVHIEGNDLQKYV